MAFVRKIVVGHSGNLGRAHDFETVLGAAERLRNESRIVFLMIGGGKHFEELAKAVKARGLENSFRFRPYQEHAMLPHSLGVADAHWVSLRPALEGLIVPSKFYAIAAAGKPMLMIGDPEGEIGRLIRQHRYCDGRRSDIDRYTAALVRSVGGYYRNGRTGATNARRTVHPPPSAGSVGATARGIALLKNGLPLVLTTLVESIE